MSQQDTNRGIGIAAPTPAYGDPAYGDMGGTRGSRWRFAWIAGAFIVVVAGVWFLSHSQSAKPQGGRFSQGGAMPVGVAKAQGGDMPVTLNALGTVTPLATVTVRPLVSGAIVKFDFAEGQMVKAGDVLAEVDPRPYQAVLDQTKGTLARDRALLANALIDLARYKMLTQQNAIAQQTYATQKALVAQDQATVKSDEGLVDAAQLNVTYAKITSPVDGRVGIRTVDLGNLVQAGQTNGIVTVTQINPISVIFSLPEDNIDAIMARVNGGATLTVEAFDRTGATKLADGKLSAVDSTIDTTTGTVKLRAMFDNTDNALFPNQFVNIQLLVNTLQNQTLIPAAAIQRGSQGPFVYVVSPDKTVAMRTVTLGQANATTVAITKGLKPGDTVVVDGADRLSDGAEVTIPSKAAISAPSAAGPGDQAPASDARRARFQKLLQSLPPDQRAALQKMSPDDRRAWMRAHRNLFHHGGGGGGGGP